jgi:SAM-dependent methyltransferase
LTFLGQVKSAVKQATPRPLRRLVGEYRAQRWNAKHEGRPVEEIFAAIYRERRWGAGADAIGDGFSSGDGTHTSSVVLPYISAVRIFLESLPCPPSVVDLGCGDFNVGQQLRPFCGPYVACDVVPPLIERNKQKFADGNVDFRSLDIIDDELPEGDIVFLRQVLQHLNNAQILRIVPKLYRYRFLVLTEHLPANGAFPPNLDKPTGAGTRLPQNSGVVLTASPFSLRVKSESVLNCAHEFIGRRAGIIKTMLYEPDR